MCGLVGMLLKGINGGLGADADIVEQLLYIDALRGEDSTGVCLFENDGDMRIIKEASTADYFLRSKEWASMRSAFVSRGKAMLGHNRKSTVGKTNDENAHPFIIDDRYVFMHNGTLTSHKHLADVEIDSHALGIHLTKCEGDPRKIEQALSNVYGAYACVWLDQKLEKIYMLKNKERPLYLAESLPGYIYGSEPMFIYAASLRNKTKIESCKEIENDTLYTFDVSKAGVPMTMETLTIKKSPPLASKSGGQGHKGGTTAANSMVYGKKGGELSKNEFKKFQKSAIGNKIWFWMDDYVERSYPDDDGNWLIWGQSLSVKFSHSISGYVSNVFKSDIKYFWDGSLLEGVIESVTYDEKNKSASIFVNNVSISKSFDHGKTTTAVH
jgi:hypothetical protein